MQALEEAAECRAVLAGLFDKYVEATLAHCRRAFKTVVPLPAINQAQTLCKILEGLLLRVRCFMRCG
jgi:dynein heavy chain